MGSYEPGVAQVVDQDLVDEAVLSEGLDHHHPLSTELQQDVGDVQRLKGVQAPVSLRLACSCGGGGGVYSFFVP